VNIGPLFDAASAVANITVAVPAGVMSGDVLLTQILVYNGTATNVPVAPAGWTSVRHDQIASGGNQVASWLYYRVSSGSEPASYTWSISPQFAAGLMGDWRGANGAPFLTSSGITGTGNPAIAAAPGLTPANNNELQIYFYGAQNVNAPIITQPAAITSRANSRSGKEGFTLAIGDKPAPFMGNPSPTYNASATGSGSVVISAQALLLIAAP
jgi:MSHA biogenesis protein MshQ